MDVDKMVQSVKSGRYFWSSMKVIQRSS